MALCASQHSDLRGTRRAKHAARETRAAAAVVQILLCLCRIIAGLPKVWSQPNARLESNQPRPLSGSLNH